MRDEAFDILESLWVSSHGIIRNSVKKLMTPPDDDEKRISSSSSADGDESLDPGTFVYVMGY